MLDEKVNTALVCEYETASSALFKGHKICQPCVRHNPQEIAVFLHVVNNYTNKVQPVILGHTARLAV